MEVQKPRFEVGDIVDYLGYLNNGKVGKKSGRIERIGLEANEYRYYIRGELSGYHSSSLSLTKE